MGGGRQTLQQGDHPSLNKQAVTPLPPTLSPLNNLDLLPSCLQATPLRLPRMSHSDRAFYADAAGEVGAGQGSRELQRPSCGKLPGPWGPVGRGAVLYDQKHSKRDGGQGGVELGLQGRSQTSLEHTGASQVTWKDCWPRLSQTHWPTGLSIPRHPPSLNFKEPRC